jgi:hypothetical protein
METEKVDTALIEELVILIAGHDKELDIILINKETI